MDELEFNDMEAQVGDGDDIPFIPELAKADPKMELQTKTVSPVVAKANAISIKNDADYKTAGMFLTEIKGAAKRVVEFFATAKKAAAEAHKAVCKNEKDMLEPLTNAENAVKAKLRAWFTEQERIRQEQERKLAEETAQLQSQAQAAIIKGDERQAEQLAIKAAEAAAKAPMAQVSKIGGILMVDIWKWKVVDETKIPREYLTVNDKALTALAKSTHGAVKVAGIEFYKDTTVAAHERKF